MQASLADLSLLSIRQHLESGPSGVLVTASLGTDNAEKQELIHSK